MVFYFRFLGWGCGGGVLVEAGGDGAKGGEAEGVEGEEQGGFHGFDVGG